VTSAISTSPPKQLGRFEVGAKIGGGGMATVYLGRAEREDGTEQVVALKVIRDELTDDQQFSNMFIDEAKILARLKHPNVIRTLEYGITGRHRYIAMELLSGRTYADVWDFMNHREQRMPLQLGAWICAQVARGLHHAHELVDSKGSPLNVIHRDVNPSNVFLTHSGEVKLIDFGLAKARMRRAVSQDGIVKGKIPYLSPEQARGQAIDRRTDVYALGATLWETVTMKRLFKRDTDVATLQAIRAAVVPDVREMFPGFPDALWFIIDKSLQVEADERYSSAAEMQRDLDAFVTDPAAMKKELAALVKELFPGQQQEHEEWAREAAHVRVPKNTMPPPAPVPIASSTMLEDASSNTTTPHLREGQTGTISSRPEALAKLLPIDTPAEPMQPPEAPTKKSSRPPPASLAPKPKKKSDLPLPAHDAQAPKRLWVSAAVVLVVCAVIWMIVASR
jgi:eukaryotic-like serine/threonine-protein kinase